MQIFHFRESIIRDIQLVISVLYQTTTQHEGAYIIGVLAVDTVVVELDLVFLTGVPFIDFGCEEDDSVSVIKKQNGRQISCL